MGIETLSADGIRRVPLWRKRWVQGVVVVAIVVVGGGYYMQHRNVAKPVNYRYGTVERGTITTAVSASGTLAAVGAVAINSPLTGQVTEVLADYNQTVTAGQILAKLDQESFSAKLRQAQAELAISKANLQSAQASVERAQSDIRNGEASLASLKAQQANAQAALDTAQRDLDRQKDLFTRNVVTAVAVQDAQTKLNSAKSSFDQVTANIAGQSATMDGRKASLSIAQAGITTATATIQQKDAAVAEAQVDLDRTTIRAPQNGMVIAKNAEVGQSVNGNNTSTQSALFTIARDLRSMEINVSVDEADIGKIQDGMMVTFTVDGYPGREFQARVTQVRLQPKTVQNVVTYTVVAAADNNDLSLLPGMTATAKIVIDQRTGAVRVPNGALRYTPVGYVAPAATAPAVGGTAPQVAGGGQGNFAGGQGGGAAAFAKGGQQFGGNGGGGRNNANAGDEAAPAAQQPAAQAAAGTPPAPGGQQQAATAPAAAGNANGGNAAAAGGQQAAGNPNRGGNGAAGGQGGGAVVRGGAGGAGALNNLTPEQAAQVQAALAQRQAAGGQGGQAGGAAGGGLRPVQAAVRTRSARVFVMGPDGQPQAVQVTIGITDGGFTEVVNGLTEGQKVIIGSDQIATAARPGGGGGPGGFFGF